MDGIRVALARGLALKGPSGGGVIKTDAGHFWMIQREVNSANWMSRSASIGVLANAG
jgi:hypothetical protein